MPFVINPRLVRGLDYYTKTAFEVQYTPLGAQSAIAGGGRYDGLVEQLGGPHTPAIGFAMGMERVLLALEKQDLLPKPEEEKTAYIVALGEAARQKAFAMVTTLRSMNCQVAMDVENKSMKSQLKHANKIHAKYVIIVGDDELQRGEAVLRFMDTSEQETIALADVIDKISSLVKG